MLVFKRIFYALWDTNLSHYQTYIFWLAFNSLSHCVTDHDRIMKVIWKAVLHIFSMKRYSSKILNNSRLIEGCLSLDKNSLSFFLKRKNGTVAMQKNRVLVPKCIHKLGHPLLDVWTLVVLLADTSQVAWILSCVSCLPYSWASHPGFSLKSIEKRRHYLGRNPPDLFLTPTLGWNESCPRSAYFSSLSEEGA